MTPATALAEEPARADAPGGEAAGDSAAVDPSTFARMDAGQRLAHLRSLFAASAVVNPVAVEEWRLRYAAAAEPAPPVDPSVAEPASPVIPGAPAAKPRAASSIPRRALKTLLGLALVAAVGYAPVQRLAQPSSVEAIVNARVITLRSPIEGEVQAGPAARDAGAALAQGDVLFRVADPRADRARVDDLARQLALTRNDRPRLAARLESARALLADLTEQTRAFRDARVRQLQARRDALLANAAAARARSLEATAMLARANRLASQGAGTAVQVDLASRDCEVAAQDAVAAERQVDANDVELDAARRGVFVGDSYNDRPTSAQRADDARQQVVDLEQALTENDRRAVRLSQDLADEQRRAAELSSAEIVAPAPGSVWEALTAPGEQVRRGQELARVLDCSGALVTATVGEAVYNRLRVGSPARFRPRDGGDDLAATVISLTGSSTTPANFAIEPAALARGAYHVAVSVPSLAAGRDCDVGRTGRVIFDGAPGGVLDALRPELW